MPIPSCSDFAFLQSQINQLKAQIPTSAGGTTISPGTIETVPAGSEYMTITGDSESGYVINIGFPESSGTGNYKGEYGTSAQLIADNPNSVLADYGYVNETSSFWYYSPTLGTYVNQNVTASQYSSYEQAVKDEIPFIIVAG